MLWVSELTRARWPPCADVLDSAVRHLVFIYIYVADPCVEPYLFDVFDVFVSPVAAVSITFSCPLETLPLSFSLVCCVVL